MPKRAVIYAQTSTLDQHTRNEVCDLEQLARQRGLEITQVYEDQVSGTRARRPGLDRLMSNARQGKFDILLVWACDRLARSVAHFLEVLDELGHLGIEFISFREQIDTGGPLDRAIVVIISAIAELERNLIVERVKSGMRRARLEGRRIGRPSVWLDREALRHDRERGLSLGEMARRHQVSKTTVIRALKPLAGPGPKGGAHPSPQSVEPKHPDSSS